MSVSDANVVRGYVNHHVLTLVTVVLLALLGARVGTVGGVEGRAALLEHVHD